MKVDVFCHILPNRYKEELYKKAPRKFSSSKDPDATQISDRSRCPPQRDIGVLAEEAGASGSIGTRWLVDPLDGTLNFVRGFPHFAVSVGLVADGRLELGVVYDPMRDEAFAARRGAGATRNGAPMRVTDRPGLQGAFVTTGFPYRVHRCLDTFLAVFRAVFMEAGALRRPGAAALDLAHTAAGIFDGFFEFCLSPWDIAAGTLLVREAGPVRDARFESVREIDELLVLDNMPGAVERTLPPFPISGTDDYRCISSAARTE